KMPAFEWVHVQLHQQKGMISLSPPTICNSAGWPKSLSVAIGGGVGLIGVDAIRGAAMRVIGNKFSGSKE
ncbi:phage holin family protein, partial [Escherichia coli]|nr:phage holin family protein [Escherichia coli]